MSFVRPEVRKGLLRWREALIGAALVIGGGFWVLTGLGVQRGIGLAAGVLGLALIWEGVRRARFPAPGGGAGVVDLDERQITYFGPLGGGSVSIDDLVRVDVRTTDLGPLVSDLFWDFHASDGTILTVPGDAEGASVIFDALAALKGVDYEAATRAAGVTEAARFKVWEKTATTGLSISE